MSESNKNVNEYVRNSQKPRSTFSPTSQMISVSFWALENNRCMYRGKKYGGRLVRERILDNNDSIAEQISNMIITNFHCYRHFIIVIYNMYFNILFFIFTSPTRLLYHCNIPKYTL